MMDTFLRDLKVGLRVLVKEKAFCALAVTVLALGICGVTTMFSVINGVMLRGFGFPNAARMENVLFIDPSTQNFFGVNGQVSGTDYEELLPHQHSFELMAAHSMDRRSTSRSPGIRSATRARTSRRISCAFSGSRR